MSERIQIVYLVLVVLFIWILGAGVISMLMG